MSDSAAEEKQCRICLDGPDPELGRLIRPCLCKGSISYVHVQCLQRWRKESTKSFYSCPQCGYKYMTARASVFGLASNPLILATFSTIFFTALVYFASFIATFFLNGQAVDDDMDTGVFFYGSFFISPVDVGRNLLRAVYHVFLDEGVMDTSDIRYLMRPMSKMHSRSVAESRRAPGVLEGFLKRLLIGLPVVGVASMIQFLWSASFLGPVNALTRLRGRNRRENGRDVAAILIVVAVFVGIVRALIGIYRMTEKVVRRLLVKAEDVILEVS